METEKAIIVIFITLILVIGFNVAIYYSVTRKKKTISQVELLRRASKTARKPFQKEDDALKELSDQVRKLPDGSERVPDDD